jgi:site-specific DNA recombinase
LETLVESRVRQFLESQTEVYGALASGDATTCQSVVAGAAGLARQWPQLAPPTKRSILLALVHRITLKRETLEVHIFPVRLPDIVDEKSDLSKLRQPPDQHENTITLVVSACLKRMGTETKLHIESPEANQRKSADHSLHRLLALAHQYNAMVMQGGGQSIAKLAAEADVSAAYFARVFRLTFLAPDIVLALLRDRHPLELTAKRLANETQLPASWEAQRTLLGLDG